MLQLDARRPGVIVPGYLLGDPALRLNIAYGYNLPALEIDEEGVYAILSFRGANAGCNIPWEAVYAMMLHDGGDDGAFVWPTDVPNDPGVAATAMETEPEMPVFRVVEGTGGDTSPADEDGIEESGERPKLRLVKD